MRQILYIFIFTLVVFELKSSATEFNSIRLLDKSALSSQMNICCSIDISIDQFIIVEKESNGIYGYGFLVDDPDVETMKLNGNGFFMHPVILFTLQIKVLTLLSDLPPPRRS